VSTLQSTWTLGKALPTTRSQPAAITLQRIRPSASVKPARTRVGARRAVQPSLSSVETLARHPAYLTARIGGRAHHCLLDSGADVSLAPSRFVDLTQLTATTCPLLAVNNTSLVVDGTAQLSVTINGRKLTSSFFVTPNIDEFILGRDWLTDNRVVWDFTGQSVTVNGEALRLKDRQSSAPTCKRAITRADITVSPRSEAILPAYVVYSGLDKSASSPTHWTTTLHSPVNGLRVARTLIDRGSGSIGVRVCNTTERPIRLYRGCTISPLQPACMVTPDQPEVQETTSDPPSHLVAIMDRVDSSLPAQAKERLHSLLSAYGDVFSKDEFDLGCTNIVQHRIDTGDNRPFRQPLRPQPRAQLPVIDSLLDEMEKQGVIQPCQSDWASNIVLVKKKDGSVRFCVDYRKLNSLTTKDAYPLPRIDTCLDTLSGAAWYSTFDLRSGFHQVALDPRDVNKTTFVCHKGTYRFPKMPFGLCNAPATFQRLMDSVLTGLNFEVCLAYLDDIIVFSRDLDTHFQRLEKLFQRLREANLKLKPSKCFILQKQVCFLGFNVSADGVSTDPAKVDAILNWPTPTNLRQSRSFVGLCQYYRRFVPAFSETAAPLHALTKKGARFEWSAECDQAFSQLKTALSTAPVLALPSDNGEYILDCDASNHSIGAVLSQIQDGEERPLCYASQLYSKHERNYNVTRKELLAVVTFTKKFRQYLLGRPFKIRTDHAALQWLKRTPEPIGQQARWLELLEEYDYTVIHRPGAQHSNADSLSRREEPDIPEPPRVQQITQDGAANSSGIDWPAVQQTDPDIALIHHLVSSGTGPPSPESIAHHSSDVKILCGQLDQLTISTDGVLCRQYQRRGRPLALQRVVPFHLRRELASELHRGLNGGHLGNRRARSLLQQRYYWPGWSAEVKRAKLRCDQCSRFQRPRPRHQGNLQPFLTGEPWERLGIDITGPHPTSSKGNVYILTVIDHFSKWVEMIPMRNQEATTVAKLLVDRVICVHGCPLQILTDRGTNFESQLFQELCKLLAVDKIRTTAYRPSTNGIIERYHGTMHAMLARWVNDNHRDWDDKLPAVAFAYRTSEHESTGFTPFFLQHGREARIPADLVYGLPPDHDSADHDFVADLQDTLRNAFQLARDQLGRAAIRRKHDYDLRARPQDYSVGAQVWCYVPRRQQGRYQKWRSFYEGPLVVTKKLGPVTYEVQKNSRSKPWTVHVDKLKPYQPPPEEPAATEAASDQDCSDDDTPVSATDRPRRTIRRPRRYRD